MLYWEKAQVPTTKEQRDPFLTPPNSKANMFLFICIEHWISTAHNKIPGTETEPTSLASHQSFMPSRCNLSREAAQGLVSWSLQQLLQSCSHLTLFLKDI